MSLRVSDLLGEGALPFLGDTYGTILVGVLANRDVFGDLCSLLQFLLEQIADDVLVEHGWGTLVH